MAGSAEQGFSMDIAHQGRLDRRERNLVVSEVESFSRRLGRYFAQMYLHLDVDKHKAQMRGMGEYHWRALLTTDNGRYYADDTSFGAVEALKSTLDALAFEIESRMSRLAEQARA